MPATSKGNALSPPNEKAVSAELVSRVKRRLWEETAEGLGNVVGNVRDAWYTGSDAVYYTREEERLNKYIPSFRYGLMASVFLFVNFRVTGNSRFQEWRRGVMRRFRSPNTQSLPPAAPQKIPPAGYLDSKRRTDVEKALKSVKFLTDGLVSLAVGTSGTLFLLETGCGKDMRKDYEEAPLVAGRSLMADEMCPGMLELYRTDPDVRRVLGTRTTVDQNTIKEPRNEDPNLLTFATFVKNCQKREEYEKRLRKERGIPSETGPVLIPHTGVR